MWLKMEGWQSISIFPKYQLHFSLMQRFSLSDILFCFCSAIKTNVLYFFKQKMERLKKAITSTAWFVLNDQLTWKLHLLQRNDRRAVHNLSCLGLESLTPADTRFSLA